MSPSAILADTTADFQKVQPESTGARTLLLAPPSLSSHPEALDAVFEAHDRSSTDIQMLDRLSLGLVTLPGSTYDVMIILTDPDGTRRESTRLMDRDLLSKTVQAIKAGGRLCSQDGSFGKDPGGEERREAVLAGLIWDDAECMTKPDPTATQPVPLRFSKKTSASNRLSTLPSSGKRKSEVEPTKPAGVGFVDFGDDLDAPMADGEDGDDDDDDIIDENTLLDGDDLATPVFQPPECRPKPGKRRRACKDCTCGLKQKMEAEDASKRAKADGQLNTLKLGAGDLAEVDFTVQGKVGSCGNCSLGDAFRCDGCPYIGLPAFKPGEEVRLLNNDVQL